MPAQKEREKRSRKTYRSTDDGRAQHSDEERERRERVRLGAVGDRRCGGKADQVQTPTVTDVAEGAVPEIADVSPRAKPKTVEWILVAWPGLVSAATRLLGVRVACPCCGRAGPVVRVLALDAWRQGRRRDGFG